MKLIHTAVTALVLGASTTITAVAATSPNFVADSASLASADRTVTIDSGTRYVNVTQGETVKFVANGREFAVAFDGVAEPIDLRKLAPAGTLDHEIDAEVAESPFNLPN